MPKSIDDLIRDLHSTRTRVPFWAMLELAKYGDQAVFPLLTILKNGTEPFAVRKYAAMALSRIGWPALEGLTTALSDPDPEIRALVVEALGDTGDPGAWPILKDALHSSHPDVCESAKTGIEMLIRQLTPEARANLIDDLANHGDSDALYALQAASSDSDPSVRECAQEGITRITQGRPPETSAQATSLPADDAQPVSEQAQSAEPIPSVSEVDMLPPAPDQPPVSAQKPPSPLLLYLWFFFAPKRLTALRNEIGEDGVRKAAALSISLLIWFPLSLPAIAVDLGMMRPWNGTVLPIAFSLLVLLGWLLTWLLGREVPEKQMKLTLKSLSGVGLLLMVLSTGGALLFISAFIGILNLDLGWLLGGFAELLILVAAVVAVGIGLALSVDSGFVVSLLGGGAVVYGAIRFLRIRWFLIFPAVMAAVVIGFLPKVIRDQWAKGHGKIGGAVFRVSLLAILIAANVALLWFLFGGWYTILSALNAGS